MSQRFRIVRVSPVRWVIQKKGWLFWHDLDVRGFVANYDHDKEDYPYYYHDYGEAVTAAQGFVSRERNKTVFQPKVVWEDVV